MLTHILGWAFAILTLFLMGLNAVFMLVSPKWWFRLPGWIRASGKLTSEKHSAGIGSLHVRILGGAVFLVLTAIVLDILLSKG